MTFLRLLPVVLAVLLLGAHFYRAGWVVLTGLCVAMLLLLFLRKPWVPRLFQAVLLLGAVEWFRTLYVFAAMRIAWDEPWTRLALILGIGVLYALAASQVLHCRLQGALVRRRVRDRDEAVLVGRAGRGLLAASLRRFGVLPRLDDQPVVDDLYTLHASPRRVLCQAIPSPHWSPLHLLVL